MQAHYTRLFADDCGRSCFEDAEVALSHGMAIPPAEPLQAAEFLASEGIFWVGAPTTWKGEAAHPAPRRLVFVIVHGEYEIMVSGGATRRFPAGSVLLIEDTSGMGHSTRITSADNVIVFAVKLAAIVPRM
jgi:hypothetical protein